MAGRLKGRFWPVLALGLMGALQGFIGWWMVQSGLEGMLDVSPVRLAVHLGLAFLILALAWRLALGAFAWPGRAGIIGAPTSLGWLFVIGLYVQIVAGALMAGSDAGRAYGDWRGSRRGFPPPMRRSSPIGAISPRTTPPSNSITALRYGVGIFP
jgi:cytochrome c oxidase assembly protein subunit 15